MTPGRMKYGNWIRTRILWRLGLIALAMAAVALLPIHPVLRAAAAVLFVILSVSFLFPSYAYYAFSPNGGNLQERVFDCIVGFLGNQAGKDILDIGTGSGVLAVKLANHNPRSQVTAIDFWGKDWEYGLAQCEENSRIGKVEDSIRFVRGDAAHLDFEDSAFDAVVSNLTFHEVKTEEDKRQVVAEALRVLKPGGAFVFVDYFYQSSVYGPAADFETYIKDLGIRREELRPIGEVIPLSFMLRHPRVLGRVGILTGEK